MLSSRALSSPSGEAAEDNVVKRENLGGGQNYVTELLNYVTEGQTEVEFEIVF